MKFINPPSLLVAMCLLTLSGCATLDKVVNKVLSPDKAQTGPSKQPIDTQEGLLNHEARTEATLTPFELRVQALKNATNRYSLNKAPLSADIRVLFAQAQAQKQGGQYHQALQSLDDLLAQQPKLSGPWVLKSDIVLLALSVNASADEQKQAQESAITYLDKALEINPDNYLAANRLGSLQRTMGQFAKAKAAYQQALDAWPGFAQGYLNLGILYDLYLGDKQLALEHYQLYQFLQDEPDRQVKGWIADLNRQIQAQQVQAD